MRHAVVFLILATQVAGCRSDASDSAEIPPGSARTTGDALTGSVIEHLSASPYTYLRINTSGGEVWAAVPEAAIENGAMVTVFNPMRMSGFASPSLKRTFDEIYFGTLTQADAVAGIPGHSQVAGPPRPASPVKVGKVKKAGGPDARTVSEAWAQKTSLVGKTITIRGVVVKYNGGVMGKNWIHLQDGSGDAAQGTNDITVTSLDAATPGDTITVTGIVQTNKDFGAGYRYAIIVEDARVAKKS